MIRRGRGQVEADRSRADEYYLGADNAIAEYTVLDASGEVTTGRSLSADEYEGWVDWTNPVTRQRMGTPRQPAVGSKGSPLFAEMMINAPKSLSVAAALHPDVSEALDAAQRDALAEIRQWLGQHAVTRIGPGMRGRLCRSAAVLDRHGLTLDLASGEVTELAPFNAATSKRSAQVQLNLARLEAGSHRNADPRNRPSQGGGLGR